ncbi:unnamed protein product [Jaminaea pallidilutea]
MSSSSSSAPDPVLVSLFAQRLMSIAEAMGRTLEQTSVSVNIRQRLDFSCALFSPDGQLVCNAPHLPVHLGSMSFAVAYQIKTLGTDGIREGDVILANHPVAGGSHLPDMTMITPVFQDGKIIFFAASRGHHADIGGILPGSMPPHSKRLFEEGAQIKSFKIVESGKYQRDELVRLMVEEPAKYPGCSGSRCMRDVESDLQAQIAANQKGINLLHNLCDEWGLETVQEYMLHVRNNAELAVRNLLKDVASKQGGAKELWAKDYMDDGSPIELKVTLDGEEGSAVFDFEGSGPEVVGNWNVPKSVVYSAIIYCLRAMVATDIPLNSGCLVPVEVRIPENSMLDPSDGAAVVGGNVLTSQRITDVVLKAFKAAAASQGDCNNLTFGQGGTDEHGNQVQGFAQYETIGGGSGAGPTWHGTSGVHTHMTNTRISDVEIMERSLPVVVRQFSIREGSGGSGRYRGGDGIVRDIQFLMPEMGVSILSERRVLRPFGMEGGGDGQSGKNTWVKRDVDDQGNVTERRLNMGGKTTVTCSRLDRVVIETPGGGGWGKEGDGEKENNEGTKGPLELASDAVGNLKGSLTERLQAQLGA